MEVEKVSKINLERCLEWHPGGVEDCSISDWGVAMAGEAGEVCDAIKKLNRFNGLIPKKNNHGSTIEEHIQAIATEIGDTYLYLDLLAQRLGLSMDDCIRDTFNRVSDREGFKQKL